MAKPKTKATYDLDDIADLKGKFQVEPKYDGLWLEFDRKDKTIKIITDEGNDVTNDLPFLVDELKAMPHTDFHLLSECVKYKGRQRLPHEEIVRLIHMKEPVPEKGVRAKIFDITRFDGEDISDKPLSERRTYLDKFADTGHIHKIRFTRPKPGAALVRAVRNMALEEGAMVKPLDKPFGKGWMKWKRQFEVDAEVVEVFQREAGKVYRCKIRGQDAPIGDTYVSSVEAKVGDTLKVSVERIRKDAQGVYHWYAPRVRSRHGGAPDDTDDMARLVRARARLAAPPALSEDFGEPLGLSSGRRLSRAVEGPPTGHQPPLIDIPVALAKNDTPDEADIAKAFEGASLRREKYCLEKHWWGKATHFDERLTVNRKIEDWTGFTLPAPDAIDKLLAGKKIVVLKKGYHSDTKWWIDKIGKRIEIPPKTGGVEGNPSTMTAYMECIDLGDVDVQYKSRDRFNLRHHGPLLKKAGWVAFQKLPPKFQEPGKPTKYWLYMLKGDPTKGAADKVKEES